MGFNWACHEADEGLEEEGALPIVLADTLGGSCEAAREARTR